MTVQINAYDPDNNGIGIYFDQYLYQKFSTFDNVSGVLSTDANATGYAFVGADGGGIVFYSATGWTVDPVTGHLVGELSHISFGQRTMSASDGSITQTPEMQISGLDISPGDLQQIFDQASDGNFYHLYTSIRDDQFFVVGSSSKDSLVGGYGSDTIYGGAGDDRIYGRGAYGGSDRLYGGDGNDKIIGGGGLGDVIYGGNGDDVIDGKGGQDIVKGGTGNDVIYGRTGFDKLYGDSGDDLIMGGRHEDRLYGGTGNDTLHGGSSADTFIFEKDAGNDVILDFKAGKAGKDLILFKGTDLHSFADVIDHATNTSRGLLISYDEGTLLIGDVKLKHLDSHDFLFI